MIAARPTGIAFEAATVGYGRATVVHEATFDVRPGEIVGLVGPNGAGKSTLLRAVTGAATIFSGSIVAGQRAIAQLSARDRARIIGTVPQSPSVDFSFSARAFAEMGRNPWLRALERPGPHDHAIVKRALELTDTARLADEAIDTLSGGDLQRLVLAQALAQEPSVLLLDEPTSHLDLDHRLQILDVVRMLADEEGIAVLAVFHDLDIAARYSDRLAFVSGGTVSAPATPDVALTSTSIAEVFSVRAVVSTDPVTGSVVITPVVRSADVHAARHERIAVVSGSGSGAWLLRRLVLAGFRVSCGALNVGDMDHSVARALGLPVVELPPFGEVDTSAVQAVHAELAKADVIVVSGTPFGRANLGNLAAVVEVLEAGRGRPHAILVGTMIAERDFAYGEAAALWARAQAAGARVVADDKVALIAIEHEFVASS